MRSPKMSTIRQVTAAEPAPTILIRISTNKRSYQTQVLLDSGADISAAGQDLLEHLDEHTDYLVPSQIIPRAANGQKMHSLGKMLVKFQLGDKEYSDDIHIYPSVSGVIISWKAAKALGILPEHYPAPLPPATPTITATPHTHTNSNAISLTSTVPTQRGVTQMYPTIFDGQIRTMEGEKFHISLRPDAKLFFINTPQSIPFPYRDKLKDEIDLLLAQNIIMEVTEATEWCASIVVTPKKNCDRIRMCVDLSHLNKHVVRERFQSSTPAQAVPDIAASEAKIFTVLDALKGYHQCPLDQESQPLTTFITPFGRFKYLRASYGISSISKHYNRCMTEAFAGLSGFRRIVDDIVIYDSNAADHLTHVKQFLQRCVDRNIALNIEKCKFFQTTVTFAGFQLSAEGYQIDQTITEAIPSYPTPTNRTDLRSFIRLVNQLTTSTNSVAALLAPLRPLQSTKNDFVWSSDHKGAFSNIKKSLTPPPVLSFFDITKPTRLTTDASKQGVGFILQQKSVDDWTLVQAGSQFLSDAESRYATIELQLLAVVWAIAKCKVFLEGLQHFHILTDHNPLVPILNNRRLDEIENPRLQRLKSHLMAFNFTAQWG